MGEDGGEDVQADDSLKDDGDVKQRRKGVVLRDGVAVLRIDLSPMTTDLIHDLGGEIEDGVQVVVVDLDGGYDQRDLQLQQKQRQQRLQRKTMQMSDHFRFEVKDGVDDVEKGDGDEVAWEGDVISKGGDDLVIREQVCRILPGVMPMS